MDIKKNVSILGKKQSIPTADTEASASEVTKSAVTNTPAASEQMDNQKAQSASNQQETTAADQPESMVNEDSKTSDTVKNMDWDKVIKNITGDVDL
jgi:hypothetical protein